MVIRAEGAPIFITSSREAPLESWRRLSLVTTGAGTGAGGGGGAITGTAGSGEGLRFDARRTGGGGGTFDPSAFAVPGPTSNRGPDASADAGDEAPLDAFALP